MGDIFGENIESFQNKLYAEKPNENEVEYAQYVGSIISDIHIAMYYFGRDDFDNWAGIPFYGVDDQMIDWSMGKWPNYISSDAENRAFGFYCNEDAMFHPAKGLLALKISGVDGVSLKNVNIENIQDETPLGSTLCGVVDEPRHGLYHFAQQIPYQIGFSMNMVMGMTIDFSNVQMENIRVSNLYSHTGLVYGFAAWFESDIDVRGQLDIHHLHAGKDDFDYDDLPNKAAEACAIRLFDDDNYPLQVKWNKDDLDLHQSCVDGMVGCLGDDEVFSHFGAMDDVQCGTDGLLFEAAPVDLDELLKSETSFIPKPRDGQMEFVKDADGIVHMKGSIDVLSIVMLIVGGILVILSIFVCNIHLDKLEEQEHSIQW